jgi:hypothetical protein
MEKIKIRFEGENASGKTRTMNKIEASLKQLWKNVKLDHENHTIECGGGKS